MNNFFSLLQQIFSNILLVFKNFFHWTASRIIIVIFAFLLAVIAFLPFFILLIILGLIDPIPWGEIFVAFASGSLNFGLISAFSNSPIYFVIETLITIIGLAFAIGVYHFKEILLYRLISSYSAEKRLRFRDNISVKGFQKYFRVFPKIFFYLSLPIIGFAVYGIVVFLLAGGAENILATVQGSVFNFISILLFVGFIVAGVSFLYIYYRFIFIYPILALAEEKKSQEIFEQSRNLTRGNHIFVILGVIILYSIIIQPTSLLQQNYQEKSFDLSAYYQLTLYEQIPKNESFLDYGITDFKNYEEVTLSPIFIEGERKFGNIDKENIGAKIGSYEFLSNVLYIFNFLLFYGIFEVILLSLYNNFSPKEKISSQSRIGKLLTFFRRKKEL